MPMICDLTSHFYFYYRSFYVHFYVMGTTRFIATNMSLANRPRCIIDHVYCPCADGFRFYRQPLSVGLEDWFTAIKYTLINIKMGP